MICYLANDYLPAFAATLAIELPVAALLGFRKANQFLAVVLVNLVTHPTIHYFILLTFFFRWVPIGLPLILAIELLVFLAEWALLAYALQLKVSRACLVSLAMNLTSYLAGVLVLH